MGEGWRLCAGNCLGAVTFSFAATQKNCDECGQRYAQGDDDPWGGEHQAAKDYDGREKRPHERCLSAPYRENRTALGADGGRPQHRPCRMFPPLVTVTSSGRGYLPSGETLPNRRTVARPLSVYLIGTSTRLKWLTLTFVSVVTTARGNFPPNRRDSLRLPRG